MGLAFRGATVGPLASVYGSRGRQSVRKFPPLSFQTQNAQRPALATPQSPHLEHALIIAIGFLGFFGSWSFQSAACLAFFSSSKGTRRDQRINVYMGRFVTPRKTLSTYFLTMQTLLTWMRRCRLALSFSPLLSRWCWFKVVLVQGVGSLRSLSGVSPSGL